MDIIGILRFPLHILHIDVEALSVIPFHGYLPELERSFPREWQKQPPKLQFQQP